jgi:hypothetical protein
MNQVRSKQIARLEKRAVPYIKQRKGIAQQLQNLHRGAVAHAAVLAFVVRYGNPQMGEPLSEAYQRVAESEAWKACCEKFPICGYHDNDNLFIPCSRGSVSLIGDPLRHVLLSTLPGANEKDKLDRVFRSAPPWLIWFTFADYTAQLLDLNLPDLSTVTGFARSKDIFHDWWGLPKSAFECRPWPDGTDGEPLIRTDLSLLGLGTRQDAPATTRERKRAQRALANSARSNPSHRIEWPGLIPEEWLRLDLEDAISLFHKLGKAEHFDGEEKRHPEFCGVDVTRSRRNSGY